MRWRISLNWDHVYLWIGLGFCWLAFIGFALVAGAHHKPRLDEVTVVLLLPLGLLVPYALGCIFLAVLRLLWPPRNTDVEAPKRVDVVGAASNARLVADRGGREHARP